MWFQPLNKRDAGYCIQRLFFFSVIDRGSFFLRTRREERCAFLEDDCQQQKREDKKEADGHQKAKNGAQNAEHESKNPANQASDQFNQTFY
jgi:hypothetical protein